MRLLPLSVVLAAAAGCAGGDEERRFTVRSSAMEPTLHCASPQPACRGQEADLILVGEVDGVPERGTIVVATRPPGAREACGTAPGSYVYRVIGLPGESVALGADGVVSVDGAPLAAWYGDGPAAEPGDWALGDDELFVLGDNRSVACDSRAWGPLPVGNVNGRVTAVERAGETIEVD